DPLYGAALPDEIQNLTNPVALAAGGDRACVMEDGINGYETLCWKTDFGDSVEAPLTLTEPATLAVRANGSLNEVAPDVCGVNSGEIKCSGGSRNGESMAPTVANPSSLVAGDNHFCLQGSNGVSCWGLDVEIPSFLRPNYLMAGRDHSCALDEISGQVACWGYDFNPAPLEVPSGLTGVNALAGGDSYSCALTNEGAQCWGDFDGQTPAQTYPLTNPTAIAGGNYHVCGIAEDDTQANVVWCEEIRRA